MKNKKLFWSNKEYKLDSSNLIANLFIDSYINTFWNDIINKLEEKQHILLLIRVKYTDGNYSTIGDLQKINKNSKNDLVKYLKNIINK